MHVEDGGRLAIDGDGGFVLVGAGSTSVLVGIAFAGPYVLSLL